MVTYISSITEKLRGRTSLRRFALCPEVWLSKSSRYLLWPRMSAAFLASSSKYDTCVNYGKFNHTGSFLLHVIQTSTKRDRMSVSGKFWVVYTMCC